MTTMDAIAILPGYTPSPPPPLYSANLLLDEQRLGLSPRHHRQQGRVPQHAFIKVGSAANISFSHQEKGAIMPSFGLRGAIDGTISLHNRQTVTKVELKLERLLEHQTDISGSVSQLILDSTILWERSGVDTCPGEVAFSRNFPSTFQDGEVQRELPPTFALKSSVADIYVQSSYWLTLDITIKRKFLTSHKRTRIPVRYYPRSRPPIPLISAPLLTSVKTRPDEWMQLTSTMKALPDSGVEPLQCHFFIPSSRIFALADDIPYHIQLSGSLASLRELFRSESDTQGPTVVVQLVRQVIVEHNGGKRWIDIAIGDGHLQAIPPSISACQSTSVQYVDFQGEIKCQPSTDIGGFSCGSLTVRDFIVLTIKPALACKLAEHVQRQVIKLVTDSWTETHEDWGGWT